MKRSRPKWVVEPAQARMRTVPIDVTPEGFWCCPSPTALHKSLKNPHHHGSSNNKQHHHHQQQHKTPSAPPSRAPSVQNAPSVTDEPSAGDAPDEQQEQAGEAQQHKICVGFGQPETSDLTVMLYGKEGIAVRMSVHRDVICESSAFFAEKLSSGGHGSPVPCLEIHDYDDAEIYVETLGLMYCGEAKHKLLKQNVSRVLRIMKVAESLGFDACVKSCLDYLEAVPWVGEEEDNVVSSIRYLQSKAYGVNPLLKRIASDDLNALTDTLAHIMEMVLKSSDDRARREMKALVLNLLKDGNRCTDGSSDICSEMLYSSCRGCLDRLRLLFAEASGPDFSAQITRQITLETDNFL
ncbi:hypothetical protein GUJ93_ZPchr0009g1309 [Zizania palustris]|uniref:BTB domain-containing protein n=1 Tax=Zizania palustris TaxID=103762 RepID=A0A8J5RZS9_ZIZPA|nr:hypothetical protein GUJ93_ZPchr0009g1309 [Zizania palustris]